MSASTAILPRAFVWRRLHSLMGLWLVLFLTEHLLVNSQAALFFGNDAQGFVSLVNSIHNLPFLEAIEVALLGVPILIHLVWGIKYLFTAKPNSGKSDGSQVSLSYARNKAYTWQRITSWILVFMIIGHVVKFRFLEYPKTVKQDKETTYLVKISMDNGLYTLCERLQVKLYDQDRIEQEKYVVSRMESEESLSKLSKEFLEENALTITGPTPLPFSAQKEKMLRSAQKTMGNHHLINVLNTYSLKPTEVIAQANDFGTASLLTVRDTFKNPIYVALYTVFVLSACFHAFNGFWTFLLTWGLIIKAISQKAMAKVAVSFMILIALLGLIAVWGTYWINLRS